MWEFWLQNHTTRAPISASFMLGCCRLACSGSRRRFNGLIKRDIIRWDGGRIEGSTRCPVAEDVTGSVTMLFCR